jgi:hypothetical protein
MYGRSLVPTRTSGCIPYGCKLVAASKSQFPAEWMRLQGRLLSRGSGRPSSLSMSMARLTSPRFAGSRQASMSLAIAVLPPDRVSDASAFGGASWPQAKTGGDSSIKS